MKSISDMFIASPIKSDTLGLWLDAEGIWKLRLNTILENGTNNVKLYNVKLYFDIVEYPGDCEYPKILWMVFPRNKYAVEVDSFEFSKSSSLYENYSKSIVVTGKLYTDKSFRFPNRDGSWEGFKFSDTYLGQPYLQNPTYPTEDFLRSLGAKAVHVVHDSMTVDIDIDAKSEVEAKEIIERIKHYMPAGLNTIITRK